MHLAVVAAPDSNATPASPAAQPGSGPPSLHGDEVTTAGVLLDVSRLLGGLLRLVRPPLGERTEQVARLVRAVAGVLDLDRPWEFEVAARLSQIGWLTLPIETHDAAWRGEPLSDEQWSAVASHPLAARDLLAEVRRLETVREMIARQREPFAVGHGLPAVSWSDRLALGGQLLRVCSEFVALSGRGRSAGDALARLAGLPAEFDPRVVEALGRCVGEDPPSVRRE